MASPKPRYGIVNLISTIGGRVVDFYELQSECPRTGHRRLVSRFSKLDDALEALALRPNGEAA